MASEGPLSPGSVVEDTSHGSVSWSNYSNAGASDNAYASVTISNPAESYYLKATNFGFAIPAGATIDGIVVEFEKKNDSGRNGYDARVRLVKGGTIQATDKALGTAWPVADTYVTHGGAADLWGSAWTPADINASNFGVVIAVKDTDGMGPTLKLDHIRITVYYTEGLTLKAVSDTLAVSLTDASSNFLTSGVTDTLTVSVVEASALGIIEHLAVSDSLNVSIVEAAALAITAFVDVTDSLGVAITESSSSALYTSVADSLGISVSEVVSILGVLQVADSLNISFTEAAALLASNSNAHLKIWDTPQGQIKIRVRRG